MGDVDGEAVHADPFPNTHADGGEFTVLDPDAGEAFAAAGLDSENGAGADEGVLKMAQMSVEVPAVRVQVEDRIADELAGAVIGGLAAAVGLEYGEGECGGVAQGGLVAQAADGVNGLVLQQEDGVAAGAGEDGIHVLLLQAEAFGVRNGIREMEDFEQGEEVLLTSLAVENRHQD